MTADALSWDAPQPFDAVLLDAPCSATGIFRRHPDVLHRIGARDIADRAELQSALLGRAARAVAPGGTLVYAVCSLERAEGEAQAAAFLDRHSDFTLAPIAAGELAPDIAPTSEGYLRTLPTMLADRGGLDGFFAARFSKRN